ncbi:protein DnrP [Atopomonas sediminilitoris]|uniref:protein DnrP n=1 Tax=Atopomonas sediminilitoris TaxID=2919919 RepID=UPI001F4EC210|nr:protein DnrP [Atopomonas sediminilitoris]MCJ8170830.1 protein DnrP [Atopomonas sediminilitoris]
MKRCLYCNRDHDDALEDCQHCGMPLPQTQASEVASKQRWFIIFWLVLVAFCFVMFFTLPR